DVLASQGQAAQPLTESKPIEPTIDPKKLATLPRFLQNLLSKLSPSEHPTRTTVVLLIASIPLVMLLRGLLSYLNIYLLCWVAIRAINDLRTRMFEHLMHLPLSFFTRSSTGDLMSRINETAVLQNTITTSVAVIIREPISILAL